MNHLFCTNFGSEIAEVAMGTLIVKYQSWEFALVLREKCGVWALISNSFLLLWKADIYGVH